MKMWMQFNVMPRTTATRRLCMLTFVAMVERLVCHVGLTQRLVGKRAIVKNTFRCEQNDTNIICITASTR